MSGRSVAPGNWLRSCVWGGLWGPGKAHVSEPFSTPSFPPPAPQLCCGELPGGWGKDGSGEALGLA